MELKDLFLTPIYLLIVYSIAYSIRSRIKPKIARKYFIPALTVKIIGAISLGIVFQFYYGNGSELRGDTGNYFESAKIVTSALIENPSAGIKLLLSNGEFDSETYQYASQIKWYRSSTEFFVIKIAGLLGVLSFSTYSVTAVFFACLSFTGMWAMYVTFLKTHPILHREFAIACFFLPSVFFWGSGLMKDSITISALGWLFCGFYNAFIEKRNFLIAVIIIFIAAFVAQSVKVYILLSFLPPALFWVFIENNNRIKSALLRNLAKPIFLILGAGAAYLGATTLTAGDEKYDLENIGERTKINSEYLTTYVSTGSAYNIGTFDGSIGSMIKVAPQAIVVAIYRPFIWEVRNPVMLLSALEASIFIFLTLKFIYKTGLFKTIQFIGSKPILMFCILFSLVFAFGVGTNSGNFGTLVRYKIPLMPFYLAAMYIMQAYLKRPRKLVPLAATA